MLPKYMLLLHLALTRSKYNNGSKVLMNEDTRGCMKVLHALFAMSRPLQLVAVTLVYLMGIAIAGAMDVNLGLTASLVGYAALIPISASIHYANEYADYETDALTQRTPFSGGSGALPTLGLPRLLALRAGQMTLLIGSVVAITGLVTSALSPAALIVLAIGAFFGWSYSVPPLQLAWRGWGELDNAMLGGVVLPMYGFTVQAGYIDPEAIAVTLPFGALVFINLLATTWPDREADAQVGKYTLATQWPHTRLRVLYAAGALMAFGMLLVMGVWLLPPLVLIAGLIPVPIVLWGWVVYTRWENPFPTVFAMVVMMNGYLLSWGWLAL